MKLASVQFTSPVFICGSFSPKGLNMSASGDRAFVVSMEVDFEKRVLWLEATGNRLDPKLRGRLFVPLEKVSVAKPFVEAVEKPAPKKAA